MPVTGVWFNYMWGSDPDGDGLSGTMSVNMPYQADCCATVALTRVANFDEFSYSQVYFIGYTANGNPVSISDTPACMVVYGADSFTVQSDVTDGAMSAQLTVFTF